MNIKQMPSPRGSNSERLYILRSTRGPRGAYDASAGLGEPGDDPIEAICDWVRKNMDGSALQKLISSLQGLPTRREEEALDDEIPDRGNTMPLVKKLGLAGDRARAKGYAERFPDAARFDPYRRR